MEESIHEGKSGLEPLMQEALALLRQIWADKPARARLRKRAQTDPNRLLALPYRVCFALNSPALLAVFCQLKGLREPST